ncbi:MAG: hypothetical protein BM564_03830 [Bacteroidetes bacterium MedPE-SWsnd-G2]|nr:MAG: hypothetical protein BM564_03830 [Bacteroidetes bacterium MedPE-SWsnd-G2]
MGQTKNQGIGISYSNYNKVPREVVYLHLNKSAYIEGETLAFTAYIFDKNRKQLSNLTENLYVCINDDKGNRVKSKLIYVSNGIAAGSFYINSDFLGERYSISAFTSWQNNFNEPIVYNQEFKIVREASKSGLLSTQIDVQLLPEGGHLLADTPNTVGVVVKGQNGLAVPNSTGEVIDNTGAIISTFKTNNLGLGKFSFIPELNQIYTTTIKADSIETQATMPRIEPKGIGITLSKYSDKVAVQFSTNQASDKLIANKTFVLAIHNGYEIKTTSVQFESGKMNTTKVFPNTELFSGMNIFTLFDEQNIPILERLYFNYNNISILKSQNVSTERVQDSTLFTVAISKINTSQFNNFSVSILPRETKSYQHHHNILSYLYLKPYVKGYIENAKYYFTNINRKKEYEIDLLLLTQGWSSFNWNSIFGGLPEPAHPFEKGITAILNNNSKSNSKVVLYPLTNSNSEIIEFPDGENQLTKNHLYPIDDEVLKIGSVGKKFVEKPSIYPQFKPNGIPQIKYKVSALPFANTSANYITQNLIEYSWDGYELLEEVLISTDKKLDKKAFLETQVNGKIDVFDDAKRATGIDFATYISTKGFRVNKTDGNLSITNTFAPNPHIKTPIVYLDNMRLSDFNILYNFGLHDVDYIVVDKEGFGEGLRGSAGVIRIVTSPQFSHANSTRKYFGEYKFPLTFSSNKRFYNPKYSFYQSQYFKNFGTINWHPDLIANKAGAIKFMVPNLSNLNYIIFIEGYANNGAFMSEAIVIE